jgi:hypothetical protein
MISRRLWCGLSAGLLLSGSVCLGAAGREAAEAASTRILIVSGPSQHPPGTHETAAGARVLKHLLEQAQGIGPVRVEVITEWPKNRSALEDVAALVFTGDLFPGETLGDSERIQADLEELAARGCGFACVHYATGLRAEHVTPDGDHPLLRWIGGYFASRCPHHQSVAQVCTATLTPEPTAHPVLRGWRAFTVEDEPYWNNYFGKDGPAPNVTPLVSAILPPEAPSKQTVAWAIERPDGGRGVGIVVPHFYRNWRQDDLRTLVLNGICWTAKLEIPADGVRTPSPDLTQFAPAAVEPAATPTSKAKAARKPAR